MFGDVAGEVGLWDSLLFIHCSGSECSMVALKTVLLNHRKQAGGKTVYYSFLVDECSDFACTENNSKFGKKASSRYPYQPYIVGTLTFLRNLLFYIVVVYFLELSF